MEVMTMKQRLFLCVLVCISILFFSAQVYGVEQWHTFMGAANESGTNDLAIDAAGNSYILGYSWGSWGNPVNAYAGEYDIFVLKLDSNGNRVWNTFMGHSLEIEGANAIALDSSGNIYVVGHAEGTWGSPIVAFNGVMDGFITKLDPNGNVLWHTYLGNVADEYLDGLYVDANGNVFVSGYHTNFTKYMQFPPDPWIEDMFIQKFNTYGVSQWRTVCNAGRISYNTELVGDASGNIYLGGTCDMSWGNPINAHAGGLDSFLAKFNSSGTLVWNTFFGSSDYESMSRLAIDTNGNLVIASASFFSFGTPINAFTVGNDSYVAKFNNNGALLWHTFIGGNGEDNTVDVTTDSNDNIYVSGYSSETWGTPEIAFGPGIGEIYMAKLSSSGNLLWHTFTGSDSDSFGGLKVLSEDDIFVSGNSFGTWGTPVDPFPGTFASGLAARYQVTPIVTYTISGTITFGGSPLANVVMNGLPGNPVTDTNGDYSVSVISTFSGTVTPTLTGYTFSPVDRIYNGLSGDLTGEDYSAVVTQFTISGTVTSSGSPLANVVMNGLPNNPVTDASGNYTASVDYDWFGTATPTLAGYTFTPVNINYSNVQADMTAQNYTATLLQYTISGTVTSGGSPLINVVINGLPGNPVTDAAGNYTATVDYGWSGTATPTLAGYAFTHVNIAYTNVQADMIAQEYTASLLQFSISGTVTSAGSPLVNVVMNGLPGNPVTDASGNYSAVVDYGWSGTVTPALVGYTFTPVSLIYSNVTADQAGQIYTATLIYYSISGTITADGLALAGATVTFSHNSHTEITDASGNYSYSVPFGTTTIVSAAKVDYLNWNPVSQAVNTIAANQVVNFTCQQNPIAVSITSPQNGATVSGRFNITANATLPTSSGSIVKVSFYVNNALLSEDTKAAYSYRWNSNSVSNGSHALKVVAHHSNGATDTDIISVTVNN
jgi:Bacterial Ig domain/Beta-propeller repeat